MLQSKLIVLALVFTSVRSLNSTSGARETSEEVGPWSQALVTWATSDGLQVPRRGKILGYYVTDAVDKSIMQSQEFRLAPPTQKSGFLMQPVPQGYSEWSTGPGKILNRPPVPHNDQFKPSRPVPTAGTQIPHNVDRIDDKPLKPVSETDLYLLSAMEKLVHRADLTDKRLRVLEETVRQLVGGGEAKPEESCASKFHRVGAHCYHWSVETLDWKDASRACRRRSAALLELPQREDARALITALLADKKLKGDDFWTGGLNPGLLWIWANSARPIQNNTNDTVTISGDGRCLVLAHEPTVHSYLYRGQDCGLKQRYICQLLEQPDKLSNEIKKAARALRSRSSRNSTSRSQSFINVGNIIP